MLRTFKFILSHPLNSHRPMQAISRYIRWQVGSRLLHAPVVVPFVNESRLVVSTGMTGATQNIYCGLHEFEDMAFTLHALRPEDTFIDVGANVGTYTVLAGAAVGASCISIEPVPQTFHHLIENLTVNGILDRCQSLNVAVGAERGTVEFTAAADTTNHALAAGERADQSISVHVVPLDEVLESVPPTLIKIDVEGFETNVIRGAKEVLSRPSLFGIIMELNGSGMRYGFDESAIHRTLLDHDFQPHIYQPFSRTLTMIDGKNCHSGNTLYLRNLDAVSERLKSAPKFRVHGTEL